MGRLSDFMNMVKERRIGFLMDEVMAGQHEFEPGMGPEGEFPIEFHSTWGPKHIGPWMNPRSKTFLTQDMKGTITVGGLCENVPCKGTLELSYLTDHRLRYTWDFSVNGIDYHFVGDKVNIKPWNLPVSHTTMFGTLVETKSRKLISRSELHFRFRTAPAFMLSWRLA